MEENIKSNRKNKPCTHIKIGDKFNKLTVIGFDGKDKHGFNSWACQCECGNIIHNIITSSLTSGNTKSCGCIRNESAKKAGLKLRKLNIYDLTGEYGIGYTSKNEPFYFDLEDYEKIKEYVWYYHNNYLITNIYNNNKCSHLYLHRLVLLEEKEINDRTIDVDHINHVPYDDRKSNLRKSEHYQNITHCKKYNNNTSGVKGVFYDKERDKWKALLTINKKKVLDKRFNTKEEAIQAREKAEKEYQKEFQYKEKEDEYNNPLGD